MVRGMVIQNSLPAVLSLPATSESGPGAGHERGTEA